jgi:hypothetical protein
VGERNAIVARENASREASHYVIARLEELMDLAEI